MKRFRAVLIGACLGIGASVAPVAAQESPLGRMVSVGDHRLHLNCTGSGAPVVVLEAGMGANHLDWVRVQPAIAATATVCSYDRAGYGWSERGPKPRTTRVIAAELRALLAAAGLPPPYLLVGHSFGGLIVRVFAADWPQDTAGLVLVDAMTPDQFGVFAAGGVEVPAEPTRGVIFSSREVLTYGIPEPWRDLAYELRNIEISMAEVRAAPLPPGLPVRVIAHGAREWDTIYPDGRMENLWRGMQTDLARELGGGAPIFAPDAGHQVPLDDPQAVDTVVIAMLATLRDAAPRD